MAALNTSTVATNCDTAASALDTVISTLNTYAAQNGADEAKAAFLRERVLDAKRQIALVRDAVVAHTADYAS